MFKHTKSNSNEKLNGLEKSSSNSNDSTSSINRLPTELSSIDSNPPNIYKISSSDLIQNDEFSSANYCFDNHCFDISVREMAVDCPDNFETMIKTKPEYPPLKKLSSRCKIKDKSQNASINDIKETNPPNIDEDHYKYLLKKIDQYQCSNLRLVNIEKSNDPLGVTILNRESSIIISRIVIGGCAQKSGILHENDEILEVNDLPVRGKTIDDVHDMLYKLNGMVSFLIIPSESEQNKMPANDTHYVSHFKALFNYSPEEDLFIPCKELGLSFKKGDILHILNQDDENWWQAYKNEDAFNSLAGIIPSKSFQERRFKQMQEIMNNSKTSETWSIFKKYRKTKSNSVLDFEDKILTYEPVIFYNNNRLI